MKRSINPPRGGLRTPAGGRPTKPAAEKAIKINLTVYPADLAYLDGISTNHSEALRILIQRDREHQD